MLDLAALQELARLSQLTETSHDEERMMVSFESSDGRVIAVYYRLGTVGVLLPSGEQLWRRRQRMDSVRQVLSGSTKAKRQSYYTRQVEGRIEHGETGDQGRLYDFLAGVRPTGWQPIRKLAVAFSEHFKQGPDAFRFKSITDLADCYPDLVQIQRNRNQQDTRIFHRAARHPFGAPAAAESSPQPKRRAGRQPSSSSSSSSSSSASRTPPQEREGFSEEKAGELFRSDLALCEEYLQQYLDSEDTFEFCNSRIFLSDILIRRSETGPRGRNKDLHRTLASALAGVEEALKYLEEARIRSDHQVAFDCDQDPSISPYQQRPIDTICESLTIMIDDNLLPRITRLKSALEHQIDRLQKVLDPQLRDRDEAKQRYGPERWKSNSNPKNDYAELRRASEELLSMFEELLREAELLERRALRLRATLNE